MASKSTSGILGGFAQRSAQEDTFYDAVEALLHPDAATEGGGMVCGDKELIQSQRRAIQDLLKQFAKKLLTGSVDLWSITFPATIFEARSYLQTLTDPWVYPAHLHAAALATDPMQRMVHLSTWFVAGMRQHFNSWRKPFNPVLGETWQARLSDGSHICMEQVSHHPAVSAFCMQSAQPGLWAFKGLSQLDVTFKGNSIKRKSEGRKAFTFQDGTTILVKYPAASIKNLLYNGDPMGYLKGKGSLINVTAGIVCDVEFGALPSDNVLLRRDDALSLRIYKVADVAAHMREAASEAASSGGALSNIFKRRSWAAKDGRRSDTGVQGGDLITGEGNWLSHLNIAGQRVWTLADDAPDVWRPVDEPLPSDCRFREDLQALARGDVKEAQAHKDRIEERQRADAKLRPKLTRTNVASWAVL